MSHTVICPDCGNVFTVDYRKRVNCSDLSFEKYEWLIAKLTNGALTDRGEQGIDVIGDPNATTYQVKKTEYEKRDRRTNNTRWRWGFHRNKIEADFVVLFYINNEIELMFLLPANKVMKHLEASMDMFNFTVSNRIKNWIWDYHISSENFLARAKELKEAQQAAMLFTHGLGD